MNRWTPFAVACRFCYSICSEASMVRGPAHGLLATSRETEPTNSGIVISAVYLILPSVYHHQREWVQYRTIVIIARCNYRTVMKTSAHVYALASLVIMGVHGAAVHAAPSLLACYCETWWFDLHGLLADNRLFILQSASNERK